ncbi:MAG: ABC transporter permease [candidate division WOR-3 bacterium]
MKIKGIIKKEFLHIIRDERTLYISFILPILLLIIFGYAIRTDLRNINIGIIDYDNKYLTKKIIEEIKREEIFSKVERTYEFYEDLKSRKYKGVLIFPEGFTRKFEKKEYAEIELILDASDNQMAENIEGYIRQKIIGGNKNLQINILFNPEMKSTYFIVPGIIAIIFMVISAILTSITLTKEFENNSIEIYKVSKIKGYELYIGKIIPYIIIGYIQLTLVLLLGKILFNIPLKGNLFLLYFLSLFFLFTGFGIGITISTIFKEGRSTLMAVWLSTLMPSIFLSGFLFPIENMPVFLQLLTYLVPARYFLYILRGILLKGLGFKDFFSEFIALLIFSSFLIAVSSIRIKKEIG